MKTDSSDVSKAENIKSELTRCRLNSAMYVDIPAYKAWYDNRVYVLEEYLALIQSPIDPKLTKGNIV